MVTGFIYDINIVLNSGMTKKTEKELEFNRSYIAILVSHDQCMHSTIRGVLPFIFIAPEVFHTCKFTQKSDVYLFGIIMH